MSEMVRIRCNDCDTEFDLESAPVTGKVPRGSPFKIVCPMCGISDYLVRIEK